MPDNEYFDHTTYPVTATSLSSSAMRTELELIAAGFSKLPTMASKATYFVRVNAGATALEAVSDITGMTINNTIIGGTTRAAASFTTLAANGAVTLTSTLAVTGTTTLGTVNATTASATTLTTATAAFGSTGTQAATLDFVNAVATSAVLPGLTGNEYKFLTTTNGTSASFTNLLKSTVIRMADGTDLTKLAAFDLSGITTATTRTVTMPDKSGTMAMTSDVALVLLATVTPTAAANVDFLTTFSATYNNYLIVLEGVLPSADDGLRIRLAVAGTTDAGTNYFLNSTGATTQIVTGQVTSAGIGVSGEVKVFNANSTTTLKAIRVATVHQSAATPTYANSEYGAAYVAANAVSGFRLYWSAGSNFQAVGKIRIYGVQNS